MEIGQWRFFCLICSSYTLCMYLYTSIGFGSHIGLDQSAQSHMIAISIPVHLTSVGSVNRQAEEVFTEKQIWEPLLVIISNLTLI